MDIKSTITLENKVKDSTFLFLIPSGTTWGTAIDAAYEFLQEIHKMAQNNANQLKKDEEQNVQEEQNV